MIGVPSTFKLIRKFVVYYETITRELRIQPIPECRCDERPKTKDEESIHLSDTGLLGELEHLKITTRLIGEKFATFVYYE